MQRALFDLRILWLSDLIQFALPNGMEVSFPPFFQEEPHLLEEMGKRIRQFGFNALSFAPALPFQRAHPLSFKAFETKLRALRKCGLKIALQLSEPQNYSKNFFEKVVEISENFDFLFWHQGALWQAQAPQRKQSTDFERAEEEIAYIESFVKKPLMYYLSSQNELQALRQAAWLLQLTFSVSQTTSIVFPSECAMKRHPVFSELLQNPAAFSRFIPVIEAREFHVHELGSFPYFAIDHYDDILGRKVGDAFCGAVALMKTVPQPKTFAHLHLWILGQKMCHPASLHLLEEIWVKNEGLDFQGLSLSSLFRRFTRLQQHFEEAASLPDGAPLKKKTEIINHELKGFSLFLQAAFALQRKKPEVQKLEAYFLQGLKNLKD